MLRAILALALLATPALATHYDDVAKPPKLWPPFPTSDRYTVSGWHNVAYDQSIVFVQLNPDGLGLEVVFPDPVNGILDTAPLPWYAGRDRGQT